MQSRLDLRLVVNLVQDPQPDERGQLMVAALIEGGQTVALILSVH
jgi:hypothetical protein